MNSATLVQKLCNYCNGPTSERDPQGRAVARYLRQPKPNERR